MESEKTVHEKELQVFCQSGVVEYLRLTAIERAVKPGYQLWVKSSFNNDELLMITHGTKAARTWVNLDRAVNHFREVYQYKGRIYLDI